MDRNRVPTWTRTAYRHAPEYALRFFDAFQHTYALHQLQSPHAPVAELRHSAEYEEANTYSNPLTIRWLPLNWLVLNFPFHNAHHRRPIEPWYRLPQVHVACFGALQQRTLNAGLLLRNYHRYRVARVLDDYGDPGHGLADPQRFAGALGVSFLTQY